MKPTKEQTTAIASACSMPTTVIQATAGSGKTATLAAIVRQAIEAGTSPEKITVLTYTNQAGREIRNRVGNPNLGYAGTLHSWCMRRMAIGAEHLLTEGEAESLLGTTAAAFPRLTRQAILAGLQTPGDLIGDTGLAVRHYRNSMSGFYGKDRVCFDTILWRAHRDAIAAKAPADLLLIDEAQDTNGLDAAIYGQFEAHHTVVVGDPNQAIYSFRGASPAWMRSMTRKPDAAQCRLTITFRCRDAICKTANRIMAPATGYAAMQPGIGLEGGRVTTSWQGDRETEIRQACAWAAQEAEAGKSVAILTRYNRTADAIRMTLPAFAKEALTPRRDPTEYSLVISALRACLATGEDREKAVQDWAGACTGKMASRILTRWPSWTAAAEAAKTLSSMAAWHEVLCLPAWAEATIMENRWTAAEALEEFAQAEETAKAAAGQIYVGTIHSAKGAEWDAVAVVGADIPTGATLSPEERRILYVATTRAREALWVSGAASAPTGYGTGRQNRKPVVELFA
jgi:superfamily I DNA/RNA helicase